MKFVDQKQRVRLRRTAVSAVVAAVLALLVTGPANAQISSTGTVSPSIGPGNTSITGTLDIANSGAGSTGSVTVENNATLEVGKGLTNTSSLNVGSQTGANGSLTIQTGGDFTATTSSFIGSSEATGTVTIDGNGSTFTTADGVNVGISGTGTLNVQNGASFSSGQFDVGSTFGNTPALLGDGTVNLTGSGSSIQINNSSATIGEDASIGRMTVSNDAQFTISDGLNVGNRDNSTGTLTIQSGADVFVNGNNNQSTFIGVESGTGTVTVDGNGSTLNNTTGAFVVGISTASGSGTLNVENGGSVVAQSVQVGIAWSGGSQPTGNGTINLSGAGSSIVTTGGISFLTLTVGDSSNTGTHSVGVLNITDGASFNSTGSTVIADETTDTGSKNVSGNGSTLTTAGYFSIGSGGSGNLNIGDNPATGGVETGGVVNSVRVGVATQNTADPSSVNVNGAGAQWNLLGTDTSDRGAMLQLASRGNATVTVSNGGTIVIDAQGTPTGSSQGGLLIGGFSGQAQADGTLNIDGNGSTVTVTTGDNQIGRAGTGTLNITNGGTLNSGSARTEVIGRSVGSTGTVNVTGAGSTWNAGDRVFIGHEVDLATSTSTGAGGDGTLNVANGGAVFAQDIIVGATGHITGGGGTITGNIQNSGTLAAGNSPGLMTIVGNLDHMAGATIEVELGGTTFDTGIPQFDYDRIDVSDDPATTGITEGIATIDPAAIFSVEFIGGFTAASGDSFDILIADTISGLVTLSQFAILPTLTAGLSWDLGVFDVSGRDSLRLFVTGTAESSVPEPSGLIILVGGLCLFLLMRRRVTTTL